MAARKRSTSRTTVLPARRAAPSFQLTRLAPSGRSVLVGLALFALAVGGYVAELVTAGPEAIAAAKALIPIVWGRSTDEATAVTAAAIAARRVSAEGQEGLRAFLEKRLPGWSLP